MPDVETTPDKYQTIVQENKLLGAKEKKFDARNLMMTTFVDLSKSPPVNFNLEKRYKRPFSPYHTQRMGSCTISSQAEALRHWERAEQFGRDIFIPEDIIDARYVDLSNRLYGGGDNGAYELDALKDFKETGFKFNKRQYKIDAFTEVPIADAELLKYAISNFRGIKICVAVTNTMYNSSPEAVVDDDTSQVIGYHSMYGMGYETAAGMWIVHTWNRPPQLFTWAYIKNRATEAYTCVDSKNVKIQEIVNLKKLHAAVTEVENTPPVSL